MRPRSSSLSMTAPESTPRISSTSSRPTGWRYAMIASVSSAAGDKRRGRSANCARSMVSAYSRRVRNCHPSAISTSSTPCSSPYIDRISSMAARTAISPAPWSSDASSSSVSGRDAANSAASSSFARGLLGRTGDDYRAEGFGLRERQRAALGQLEEGDERRQYVDDRGAPAHDVGPAELLPRRQERVDPGGRPFDVERARHHAVEHRFWDERDDALCGGEQIVEVDLERCGRRIRRRCLIAAAKTLSANVRGMSQPVHELTDLLVFQQPADELGPRIFPFVIPEPARQQQLRLDAQEARGHFEIIGGLVESELVDH